MVVYTNSYIYIKLDLVQAVVEYFDLSINQEYSVLHVQAERHEDEQNQTELQVGEVVSMHAYTVYIDYKH